MSLPEEDLPIACFVQEEEMIDSLSEMMTHQLNRMPSQARLRLLAFMHLSENLEDMDASLEIDAAGHLRLSLNSRVTPSRSHQH